MLTVLKLSLYCHIESLILCGKYYQYANFMEETKAQTLPTPCKFLKEDLGFIQRSNSKAHTFGLSLEGKLFLYYIMEGQNVDGCESEHIWSQANFFKKCMSLVISCFHFCAVLHFCFFCDLEYKFNKAIDSIIQFAITK